MKKGKEIRYLDYTIKNCLNDDGIILFKKGKEQRSFYECHLGNFKKLIHAKEAAILYFMIARPEKFATHIYHYLIGSATSHEWFALKDAILNEGLEIPKELSDDGTINFSIIFNGKKLSKTIQT